MLTTSLLRCTLLIVLLALPCAALTHAGDAKPNILLIVADDLGWADVGWHGGKFDTPVMDGLVKGGLELDRHYVQPVCSPTRTALLSGRYPSRFGPHALVPTNLRAFPAGTVTLASLLKSTGYSTFIAGKWHLGSRPEWGPNHYGFDHSYGTLTGAADPSTHGYRKGPYAQTWHRNGKLFEEEGNTTELIAAEAVKKIRQKQGPWLVYVPFHAVHIPIDAPDEYKQRYAGRKFDDDPKKDDAQRRMAAFVTQMDTKIGQFIAALDETGQRENTLVVFTSDNGGKLAGDNPYISTIAGTPKLSSNLPLRGQKDQLYEGGVRVCAFANWPGKLAPRKISAPMHAVDWLPTLAALAGCALPPDLKLDGHNHWPLLSGEKAGALARTIYIPSHRGAALIHDGWKLIVQGAKAELFHLERDPHETTDLAEKETARVEQLRKLLDEIKRDDVVTLPADLQGLPK